MSVLALHHRPDESEARRYGVAAIAIVLLHVVVIVLLLFKLERWKEAAEEFERAAGMTQNARERTLLAGRADEARGKSGEI